MNKIIQYSKLPTKHLDLNNIIFNSIRASKYKNINNNRINSNLINQSNFLKKELPKRLAGITNNIINLPFIVAKNNSFNKIIKLYIKTFDKIILFNNIKTISDVNDFKILLQDIKDEHSNVPYIMNDGLNEFKINGLTNPNCNIENNLIKKIDMFVDEFYTNRINIRTIIKSHIDIIDDNNILFDTFNLVELIENIKSKINFLFSMRYNKCPKILFKFKTSKKENKYILNKKNIDLEFFDDIDVINITYIKSHLNYILFEILKNSCKATIDNSINKYENLLSDIIIELTETDYEFIFKISDEGGGFKRENLDKVFSYLYKCNYNKNIDKTISGWGHGISLARLYSRYLGGELILIPYENYGCDCIFYIKKFDLFKNNSDANLFDSKFV